MTPRTLIGDDGTYESWQVTNRSNVVLGVDSAPSRSREILQSVEPVCGWVIPAHDIVPGADNRDIIARHLAAATAQGVRRVILPPGNVDIGAQITISVDDMTLEGSPLGETVIRHVAGFGVNKALIYAGGAAGAKVALSVGAEMGSTILTVPDAVAATLAPGDVLGLESDDVIHGASRASEIRAVVSVSGEAVTVDGPLLHAYDVADSAVAWKITPRKNITIRNLTITSADPAVHKARGVFLLMVQNARVERVTLRNAGGGIFFHDCLNFTARDVTVDRLPNQSNHLGYGIAAAGRSAHGHVDNLYGRHVRHLFTTLADEHTGAQWGGPRHITISGGVGEAATTGTTYAIWDTHPYGFDIVFNGCRAYGGSGGSGDGFQLRARSQRLIGCAAHESGNSGVKAGSADGVQIVGGEFAGAAGAGIKAGTNTHVSGAHIHDNAGPGVAFGSTSLRARVTGSLVADNQYGFHDQSTTGTENQVVAQGNTVPRSASQTVGCLSPKGDFHWVGNITRGYGALSDGVGGSPDSAVTRSQNVTDPPL